MEGWNFYDMMAGINQESSGAFGIFLLFSIFMVCMIVFKKSEYDTKATFLVSSSITLAIGILLWAVKLLAWQMLSIPFILFVGSIMLVKFSPDQ
jgi:hypothetical protein